MSDKMHAVYVAYEEHLDETWNELAHVAQEALSAREVAEHEQQSSSGLGLPSLRRHHSGSSASSIGHFGS